MKESSASSIHKAFYYAILILFTALFACSDKENQTVQNAAYHLDILYGTVENYTGNDGQWLNIYQAESSEPTPVYIWAHGNGHTYRDAHEKYEAFITKLLENGISVISWESIKQMDESNYMDILEDADIMYQWVKDNAADYNLNTSKVVIGGHSRGTIASWRLAHSGDAGIKGIYHGDAAGNLDDVNEALGNLITTDSPPIQMAYTQNKTTNDGQHDPNEGQKIIDLYSVLNFRGEDAKLLVNQGYPSTTELGFYSELLPFCEYVLN
jgi:acetyl esterase/lipase